MKPAVKSAPNYRALQGCTVLITLLIMGVVFILAFISQTAALCLAIPALMLVYMLGMLAHEWQMRDTVANYTSPGKKDILQ